MQLLSEALTLNDGLDWTGLGAATSDTPQGLEGSTPWRICYKVARSKQGITESLSLSYDHAGSLVWMQQSLGVTGG